MQSPAERHSHILNLLDSQGYVTVTELSKQMHVSEATIRRDLGTLEERNLLYRTHGGANPITHRVYDQPVSEKAKQHTEEKARIGSAAANLVDGNESVILASGTTVREVARHLRGISGLTVVTSAMNVALELTQMSDIRIIMLGGLVRLTSTSVVGPSAVEMMETFSCRHLFLGVDGIDLRYGLSTSSHLEAHLNKAMITSAQETTVVTDSSKFGLRGFSNICRIDTITRIVTDTNVLDSTVRQLEDRGVDVLAV